MPAIKLPFWSAKDDDTVAGRAVLLARTGSATSVTYDVGQVSQLDLVIHETAGGTALAQVEWWYSAAGIWIPDTSIGTGGNVTVSANGHLRVPLNPSAGNQVRVKLGTFAAGGTVSCWLQGRYPRVR
jgi:hypothetical protein